MSTIPEKPVEKELTLWRIASYRRMLYLAAALMILLTANMGVQLAQTAQRGFTALSVLSLIITSVLLFRWNKTELANMMLVGAAMNLAAYWMPDPVMMICAIVLCIVSAVRMALVMNDVIRFAKPEKIGSARAIAGCLLVLPVLLWWLIAPDARIWLLISSLLLMVCTLNLPIDRRYTHKLRRCLTECPNNEHLRKRLEWVFVQPHRRPWLLLFLKCILRPLYHFRCKDVENIHEDEDNPLIYLCNHGINFGPVSCILHLPSYVRPWSISYIMVDRDEAADYMHRYSFGETNHIIPEPLKWPVSRFVARFSIWALNNLLEGVPVFRDKPRQLMNTFRLSSDALASGDQLLIFPENPNAVCQDHGYEREGLGELFSGFAMIAPIYYNRTGKRARFMPMYAHPKTRTLSFGHEVQYDPDHDPRDERNRLTAEIEAEMRRLMEREDACYQSRKH